MTNIDVEQSHDSDNSNDTNNNIIYYTKTTRAEVRQMKVLVLLAVLFSICGAVGVFFYTKLSENKQFQKQYEDDSNKVLSSLLSGLERGLGALNTLSTSIVTYAEGTNQTFPFVRMGNYAAQAAQTLQFTNAFVTAFAPVVKPELRQQWEQFASSENNNIWNVINETAEFMSNFDQFHGPLPNEYNWSFIDKIYSDNEIDGIDPSNTTQPFYVPEFQLFPLVMVGYGPANYDWYGTSPEVFDDMMQLKQAAISHTQMIVETPAAPAMDDPVCTYYTAFLEPGENCLEPNGFWYYPVLDKVDYIDVTSNPNFPQDYEVKGFVITNVYWKHLIRNILPHNSKGVIIVFEYENTKEMFTYQIDGPLARYVGGGDKHDPKYDKFKISRRLNDLDSYRLGASKYYGLPLHSGENKTYTVHIYPSDDMKSRFTTSNPIVFALSAAAFILFPFVAFLVYERKITRQQQEILSTANRSHAIVSSLFPSNVRDQLYLNKERNVQATNSTATASSYSTVLIGPPIAELYPETTVLFTDIVNFTKWSSARDASQVFMLLESVYCAFDAVASRMKIFKVETIGDCYVAVAGLPDPRPNHSEVMAVFGQELLKILRKVTADLATTLGPGTSTLQMRVGLNSGPTTAGVLRGNKGRFQLFGDTVNTAARMESNSLPGKILCSQKTADHLISLGKEMWIQERDMLVDAKGKGMMQTFWVDPTIKSVQDWSTSSNHTNEIIFVKDSSRDASIDWMAKVLESALEEVVWNRDTSQNDTSHPFSMNFNSFRYPLDEVTETIVLPKPSQKTLKVDCCNSLSADVKHQIVEYVSCIAESYRNNPFHNFHHASHVVMSTQKLLNRIVRPSESHVSATAYGIASDSLSQFAILFSALIHDVDHPGVSNAQLVKECAPIAIKYNNKSVAEQNSVTLAWDLLMEDRFFDLRNQIMQTESEAVLFRKLIVNSVMATDLFDSELKKLRETRWATVFSNNGTEESLHIDTDEDCNRRATIIIEHIIQASDVCHTMQHWHVYQEWNRRLFDEMYTGYKAGRVEKDPSEGWYAGELWFFDNYIIPLAKKLETCGVFGVSCGELLDYARDNRSEWAAKGREIVKENVVRMESKSNIAEQLWTQPVVQEMNDSDIWNLPVLKMEDNTEHSC